MNNHNDREHALLGGSTAERWSNCTGSVFLSKDLPPEAPSAAAEEGTKAHELAEIALTDFLEHKETGSDPSVRLDLAASNYDPLMVDCALDYRNAIWEKVLLSSVTGKAYGLEEKFEWDKKLQIYGFVDFWCIYISERAERLGVVVDYKYGYTYVDVKKNGQLAFYASAMRRWARKHGKELDKVRAVIFQPRSQGEAYRETVFTAKQLDAWDKKFERAVLQIYSTGRPLYKVGSWCRFCPAQGICPKYGKELSKKTALQFIDPEKIELPAIPHVSDEVLAKVITHADELESFISACKAYAINRHLNGHPIAGLKVVLGSTRRKWLEDEKAIAESLIKLGVADPYQYKLKPLTMIEKVVGREKVAPFLTTTTPKPSIVPESDPRPAVQNVIEMLEDKTPVTE